MIAPRSATCSCRTFLPTRLLATRLTSRTVPAGAGNGQGNLRQAGVALAIPGKALGEHRHPMHPAVPFAAQHGARTKLGSTPAQVRGALSRFLGKLRAIKQALTLGIQIAEMIRLQLVGEHPKQKVARQVNGRSPAKYRLPAVSRGERRAGGGQRKRVFALARRSNTQLRESQAIGRAHGERCEPRQRGRTSLITPWHLSRGSRARISPIRNMPSCDPRASTSPGTGQNSARRRATAAAEC